MAFKDKLTQALTAGNVKVGTMTEKTGINTNSRFSAKNESDKGLATALMGGKLFVKETVAKKDEKIEE